MAKSAPPNALYLLIRLVFQLPLTHGFCIGVGTGLNSRLACFPQWRFTAVRACNTDAGDLSPESRSVWYRITLHFHEGYLIHFRIGFDAATLPSSSGNVLDVWIWSRSSVQILSIDK